MKKARVRATREIVFVEANLGYPGGYVASNGNTYLGEELEVIVDCEPDYWTRLEHQYDNKPYCGLRGFRSDFNVERCEAESDKVPNGYELQKDGYFSWVEKKKEYPKTYKECCEILDVPTVLGFTGMTDGEVDLFGAFISLKRCRDAYWKIAGEEMGLGKPWEPDWENQEPKYCIFFSYNSVEFDDYNHRHHFLAFPTPEMRDAFYENFDPDIDFCKEFL